MTITLRRNITMILFPTLTSTGFLISMDHHEPFCTAGCEEHELVLTTPSPQRSASAHPLIAFHLKAFLLFENISYHFV